VGVPVFVDIRPDNLNIDESKIEAAITPPTKAIVPVHYAGVGCELNTIMEIAQRHHLLVIEDTAQGLASAYKGNNHWYWASSNYQLSRNKKCNLRSRGVLLVKPAMVRSAEIIWQGNQPQPVPPGAGQVQLGGYYSSLLAQ